MGVKPKEYKRISWNSVQPKEITWLWQDRIPFGKISLLVGDSGYGKTTIALDIAARLTTGRPMPLSDAEPITGNVIFQSNEDEVDDTLIPRFISAGGDRNRIVSIDAADLNIDDDCDIIEQNIADTNARLVIFDPLQSFMGKNADMCRITDVRRLLTNLGGVAARNNCAVLVIAHQNKAQGAKDLFRVFGSVDITATARSVLRVGASSDDPDARTITHIKSSVSRPAEPIAFRIEDDSPVIYLGEYHGEINEDEIADDYTKRAKATEIICSMLKDSPKEGTEVYKACKAAGIGARTVERVKQDLKIRSGRDGKKRIWIMP